MGPCGTRSSTAMISNTTPVFAFHEEDFHRPSQLTSQRKEGIENEKNVFTSPEIMIKFNKTNKSLCINFMWPSLTRHKPAVTRIISFIEFLVVG